VIKPKNGLRPKNREKQNKTEAARGREGTAEPKKMHRPADSHDEVFYRNLCGKYHFFAGSKKSSSKAKGRQKICASSETKVRTFVIFFPSLVRFWAFLGKGNPKTRENKLSKFPKHPREPYFSRGFFLRVGCFYVFSFRLFLLRW
jgi:hypothetical protein